MRPHILIIPTKLHISNLTSFDTIYSHSSSHRNKYPYFTNYVGGARDSFSTIDQPQPALHALQGHQPLFLHHTDY